MPLDASTILRIPITNPGVLFTSKKMVKHTFRELAKVWHPDKPTGNSDVFSHISKLYEQALTMTDATHWDTGTTILMEATNGKKYSMRYKFKQEFELGTYYVSDTVLTYMVRKEHSSLFDIAIQTMNPVFTNSELATEMGRFLPSLKVAFDTPDHRVLILNKTEEVVPLRWVVQHFGKVEPKQVAWMTSALLNLCCGLQVAGTVHNDISLDTVFVSIKYHSALLLGGWWWAGKTGEPMKSLPKRTFQMLPTKIKEKKKHSVVTMLTASKTTIMEALGGLSGPSLRMNKAIPEPFVNWLLSPSGDDAIREYSHWKSTVLPAMGYKKEFILWDIPQEELLT